jgi:hypothetical protein
MSKRHRLRYRRIVWNTVYTYETSNTRYVNNIKVTGAPFIKATSDFKSMYIGSRL